MWTIEFLIGKVLARSPVVVVLVTHMTTAAVYGCSMGAAAACLSISASRLGKRPNNLLSPVLSTVRAGGLPLLGPGVANETREQPHATILRATMWREDAMRQAMPGASSER
jgi:hypothetical protein